MYITEEEIQTVSNQIEENYFLDFSIEEMEKAKKSKLTRIPSLKNFSDFERWLEN